MPASPTETTQRQPTRAYRELLQTDAPPIIRSSVRYEAAASGGASDMLDLDPRDRDDDRRDLDVKWVQVGRGPSQGRGAEDASEQRQDPRDREREARDRTTDPRDVFAAHLEL